MPIQDFSGDTPGYGQSPAQQIAGLVGQLPNIAQKQSEQQATDTSNQTKLYFELRQQGYTKADAADRVNRSYRSTNFMQKLLGGQGNAFQQPVETDKIEMEQNKAKAEAAKLAAETEGQLAGAKKDIAHAGYYEKGGAAGYKDYNGMTPNQLQMEIKANRDQLGISGDPEDDAMINQRISHLQGLLDVKSGFKAAGSSDGAKVLMTGPDGKKYHIPSANVAKARARGFK